MNTLSDEQIEAFIENGWLKLDGAIHRETALQAQMLIWEIIQERFGVLKNDKSTWTDKFIQISENFGHGAFKECNTLQLINAVDDLLGENQWEFPYNKDYFTFGWWPINFSVGFEQPWDVPVTGWHWDGMHFRHFLDSQEQGLLMIILFSDTEAQGGGTLIAEGSHKIVTKFLSQFPDGIEYSEAIPLAKRSHPWLAELTNSYDKVNLSEKQIIYTTDQVNTNLSYSEDRIEKFMHNDYIDSNGTRLRVVELTGLAGDVFLCHPFLFHSGSYNHSGVPRIMCNLNAPLLQKMNFNRPNIKDYSAIEISIKNIINKHSKINA